MSPVTSTSAPSTPPAWWTPEHAQLLQQSRLAAGLEPTALAIQNALSVRQLHELENGGSSAFYSPRIQYVVGVRLLDKLGVAHGHLVPAALSSPGREAASVPAEPVDTVRSFFQIFK